jgi:hypothetical protein
VTLKVTTQIYAATRYDPCQGMAARDPRLKFRSCRRRDRHSLVSQTAVATDGMRLGPHGVAAAVRQGPDEHPGFGLVEVPAAGLLGLVVPAAERPMPPAPHPQAPPGLELRQTAPGIFTWTIPVGRTYTTTPEHPPPVNSQGRSGRAARRTQGVGSRQPGGGYARATSKTGVATDSPHPRRPPRRVIWLAR